MACLHIASGVHVCRPDGVWGPVPGRRRKRFWCFHCRKHLVHTLMWFVPAAPSYYGPSRPSWTCPTCQEEQVLFPGREWVDDDD